METVDRAIKNEQWQIQIYVLISYSILHLKINKVILSIIQNIYSAFSFKLLNTQKNSGLHQIFILLDFLGGRKMTDPVVLGKKSSGLAKLGIWSPISLIHICALIKFLI